MEPVTNQENAVLHTRLDKLLSQIKCVSVWKIQGTDIPVHITLVFDDETRQKVDYAEVAVTYEWVKQHPELEVQ